MERTIVRFEGSAPNLDLERCLFSGQVFRWEKDCPGRVDDHPIDSPFRDDRQRSRFHGVDGEHWFAIERVGDRLTVETNGSEEDFTRLFRLDADVSEIERKIAAAATAMARAVESQPGLRMMRPSDPVEVFFGFLCTANNHLKRIMPMVRKLAEYGEPIGETGFRRFPRAEAIASIPDAELRAKGFGYRGATIPYAAREVLNRGGDEWIWSLKEVGYEEAHRELVAIKGIGHKLADCICLYGFHYDEAVPIDTHLWQAACRVFFPEHADEPLTELRYRQVGDFFRDRFGDLAGWAHLFLYFDHMASSDRTRR